MWTKSVIHRVVVFLIALTLFDVMLHDAKASFSPIDQVVVYKSRKIMQLLIGNEAIRTYRIAIGRNPIGHKQKAGDCRTPEGVYFIDRHKKDSKFYKALHISYPNKKDIAAAKDHGHSPGADIMIHGLPKGFEDLADIHFKRNWTKGCIAVNNSEIDDIWRLVADGTPIIINP